jgi:hypothetical protein
VYPTLYNLIYLTIGGSGPIGKLTVVDKKTKDDSDDSEPCVVGDGFSHFHQLGGTY